MSLFIILGIVSFLALIIIGVLFYWLNKESSDSNISGDLSQIKKFPTAVDGKKLDNLLDMPVAQMSPFTAKESPEVRSDIQPGSEVWQAWVIRFLSGSSRSSYSRSDSSPPGHRVDSGDDAPLPTASIACGHRQGIVSIYHCPNDW